MVPPVLVVQHEDDAPPAQLADALAAHRLPTDLRRPDRGDALPATPDGLSGVVVLGGAMSAGEDAAYPWLPRTRALLAAAAPGTVPALGICLGAQLAAAALGGTVARRAGGFEIGWTPVRRTAAGVTDPVLGAVDDGRELLLWHQDAFLPPAGAEALLEHGLAFRAGSLWAVQHHPEVDTAVVASWCDDPGAPAQLAQAGATRDELVGGAAARASAGRRLLDAWCRVVAERGGTP
jgi:GMP synthase (glutamine-hydrolysing)